MHEVIDLLNLTPAMPGCPAWIQLQEIASKGFLDEDDAFSTYFISTSLRIVRHEAAHIAGLLMLSKPGTYTLRTVKYKNNPSITVTTKLKDKIIFISKGFVPVKFGKMPESGYTAFCMLLAPEIVESKFCYSFNGQMFEEGGTSHGDMDNVAIVISALEKEGHNAEILLAKANDDLKSHREALLEKVSLLTSHMYPAVMAGKTKFTPSELKRAYRGSM